jgi:hypothetical protein
VSGLRHATEESQRRSAIYSVSKHECLPGSRGGGASGDRGRFETGSTMV